MNNRMEAKFQEITLGETVCAKLKIMYFKDTHWSKCVDDVAKKFTQLKAIARKFYIDKSELEMLKEISRYSKEDIIQAFDAHAK